MYKKLSEYAKENSVTYRTAWNRFNAGKIKGAFMDNTGHVLIPLFPDLKKEENRVALYARVSNNDRKKELDYQLNRLREFSNSNGYLVVEEVKEIASGMNDSRSKLINLLSKNSNWDIIIVENKDRLTRFGFNYIETLLGLMGKKIIVVNQVNEDKQDLLNDLISIFYSFSARMYGLRKKKTKEQIINFIEQE